MESVIATQKKWKELRAVLFRDRLTAGDIAVIDAYVESLERGLGDRNELLTNLQGWVAGCGDEHFSTQEECLDLLNRSGELIARILSRNKAAR